ncbi:MAG: type II toxin-antitoxin system VapC family toxin [Vicinamibacterales bacterium]
MKRIVVDASALAALIFQEPESEAIKDRLAGATVFAPALLRYELTNTALKKVRRQPLDAVKILTALAIALDDRTGLVWQDVDARDVALLAQAAELTAYDASYLWLAGALGADLVTLDRRLAKAVDTLASPDRLRA